MQLDPRHPNIAFAANTVSLIGFLFLLFSLFFSIGTAKGWSVVETILGILVVASYAVSWWAKRERDIPVVHTHSGSASQYEAMENLPTMVNLDTVSTGINPNTAAVIASIVGETNELAQREVANAIDTLSSGEIGASSAAAVSHNDAEPSKQYVQQKYDQRGFQTEGVANVPLPSVKPDVNTDSNQTPSMVDLDELLTSETQNANIPELDLPDLPNFE